MLGGSRVIEWRREDWPTEQLVKAIRHSLDDPKIQALVQAIQEGHDLPPIFVLWDDSTLKILDGHHRAAAWARSGMETAPLIVGRMR